ncbi:hypothetical protein B0T21DRAFT_408311 [Apiosordaria backusii]|uniref:Uncharacterized protein n=1 Tax=Apiosordaria backusii TaxID=314023 RepID=A0AA40K462_9PEZI|nr:hypothetical protein B0T21DRAFT_408311 [Apiosordaria backusii]
MTKIDLNQTLAQIRAPSKNMASLSRQARIRVGIASLHMLVKLGDEYYAKILESRRSFTPSTERLLLAHRSLEDTLDNINSPDSGMAFPNFQAALEPLLRCVRTRLDLAKKQKLRMEEEYLEGSEKEHDSDAEWDEGEAYASKLRMIDWELDTYGHEERHILVLQNILLP